MENDSFKLIEKCLLKIKQKRAESILWIETLLISAIFTITIKKPNEYNYYLETE